jgi:tellurite resistance protein TehA-like permease
MNPGYGTWVMATGIVSTGLGVFGYPMLSDVLLGLAAVAFAALLLAYGWRLAGYRAQALTDARNPARAFGYFSVVAAFNVVGLRLAREDHHLAMLVLGVISLPFWLVLTYAIPGVMIMGRRSGSVLAGVNGSWFLWVVSTQSLAAVAATLAGAVPGLLSAMAPLAVALWGIGVVLYLMLLGLVTLRLLDEEVTPHALSPAYWVFMGATAITVLAASRILLLHAALPVLASARQVVSGLAFLLWAFGTWWIPLLLIFAIWRHLVHREPIGHDSAWWSMVFPLGMYAVASADYGRVTGLGFMVDIARVEVWVGFGAWLGVALVMARSLVLPAFTRLSRVGNGM